MIHICKNQKELDAIFKKYGSGSAKKPIQLEIICGEYLVVENAYVVLLYNSHAVLWHNSHAELWSNSHAELRDNSHAELYDFSVVHNLTGTGKGVTNKVSPFATVINVCYPDNIEDWCKMKGIEIDEEGCLELWKTTRKDGTDFHSGKVNYDITDEIVCPDWDNDFDQECGHAIHLSDSPSGARMFCGDMENGRLFKVRAHKDNCRVFPGLPNFPMKIRAKKCTKIKEYPLMYSIRRTFDDD